jgi:hypothetical protein
MRRRRLQRLIAAPLLTAAVAVVPAATGQATSPRPGLRLLTTLHHVDVQRFGKQRVLYIPSSIYVASTDGPFEVHAIRRHGALTLEQVRRDSHGVTRVRTIYPPTPVHLERGLPRFFNLKIVDGDGQVVLARPRPFCPTADFGASRVDASGPLTPSYPYFCGSPLTRGMVWGIDRGWAVPLFLTLRAPSAEVPDGDYSLVVSISYPYRRQLGLTRDAATATLAVTIGTETFPHCPPKVVCGHAAVRRTADRARREARAAAPAVAFTPGSGLPDLRALPAHNVSVQMGRHQRRDFLAFGATMWNAGPGNLVVEGFRRGSGQMTAKQFLFRDGQQVRAETIGSFEFDQREGHHHWHLRDFARYDLLNRHRNRVLLSGKQSFCLAPTDPVDLGRPGALWQPDKIGLFSACPSEESIWLRETMPSGWGDTYVQSAAGQAFNITDLHNGVFFIRVTTNPHRRILETSTHNNSSLLKVRLGGVPGARTVKVIGPRQP